MPSQLFTVLFLIAFFVPITMYLIGVVILFASLLVNHWGIAYRPRAAHQELAARG